MTFFGYRMLLLKFCMHNIIPVPFLYCSKFEVDPGMLFDPQLSHQHLFVIYASVQTITSEYDIDLSDDKIAKASNWTFFVSGLFNVLST